MANWAKSTTATYTPHPPQVNRMLNMRYTAKIPNSLYSDIEIYIYNMYAYLSTIYTTMYVFVFSFRSVNVLYVCAVTRWLLHSTPHSPLFPLSLFLSLFLLMSQLLVLFNDCHWALELCVDFVEYEFNYVQLLMLTLIVCYR